MATTAKSKSTKTNPAHKAASKPTAAKAKATKAKTTKTTKPTKAVKTSPAAKSPCRGCEIFFGIIMIILALTMIADVIVHLCIWLWK